MRKCWNSPAWTALTEAAAAQAFGDDSHDAISVGATEHHINAAEFDGYLGVTAVVLGITSGADLWRLSSRTDLRRSQWHSQETRQRLGLRLGHRQAALRLLLQNLTPFEEGRLGKPPVQAELTRVEARILMVTYSLLPEFSAVSDQSCAGPAMGYFKKGGGWFHAADDASYGLLPQDGDSRPVTS